MNPIRTVCIQMKASFARVCVAVEWSATGVT